MQDTICGLIILTYDWKQDGELFLESKREVEIENGEKEVLRKFLIFL